MKPNYEDIKRKTYDLINQTRANPQMFVKELQALTATFKGKTYRLPGTNINIVTQEGRFAVDDAIKFLKVYFAILGEFGVTSSNCVRFQKM